MRQHSANRLLALLLIPLVALVFSGCYSARVTTGKEPSGQVVEKAWATGFINGLVTPGAKLDVAQQCPNGVAIVETKLSFLNQLVGGLTFGLYSPMHVKVTCAAGGSMSMLIPPPALEESLEIPKQEVVGTLRAAALKSARTAEPVRVTANTE